MFQPHIHADPGTVGMLVACVLGMGFMARFLAALSNDENKIRMVRRDRQPHRYGEAAFEPGAYVALGVLRITSALASKPGRGAVGSGTKRDQIVTFTAAPSREPHSATERHYHLG